MKITKKITALVLALLMITSVLIINVSAAEDTSEEVTATTGITVHYKSESGAVPNIYYWNSLPKNINEPSYPGPSMIRDSATGTNWFTYTFNDVTKINMLFIENGTQSKELTRNSAGEYWYKGGRWYTKNPELFDDIERTDFREETIYFVITTRFYDGDTGNNVKCWDGKDASNDPSWRGDFKGLIEKLDYIKALGFSAIWITPVVTNASGYDYHGYHAFDFSTVDVRYESSGATYQDLIDAVHEKGMKIVQDVVWNHNGNFGEATMAPMFTKEYSSVQDLGDISCMKMIPDGKLAKLFPNYYSQIGDEQYKERLSIMKNTRGVTADTDNYYHHSEAMSWESDSEQTGQIDGNCVDINTENPKVAKLLTDTYLDYANMGVDAFRLDTEKHINRWTLNSAYFPAFSKLDNFFIFGEVCAKVRDVWNKGIPSCSAPFYTWAETESSWKNNWSTDQAANLTNSVKHWNSHTSTSNQPTSQNAFLSGNEYHKPDYSKSNGTGIIDFQMHWNFYYAWEAFSIAKQEDQYINDSTWNVVYVDSHDYAPDTCQKVRYNGGTQSWAENMCLMFTFRGIPCIYYGSEIEFQKGKEIDRGTELALVNTGRAYYGDNITGTVTASDFSKYTASGNVKTTLEKPLSKQLQKLNAIRRAIPALQKGQYSVQNVSGDMCFKRGYTDPQSGAKSFACVAVTNAGTFTNVPNGTYIDAVTGDKKTVSNGTLSISAPGKGNCRVYVLSSNGYTGITGKIGDTTTYLK